VRVLIIEDNRDAADSLKLLLEMLGHEIRAAYTGPDGVEAARAWRPDAVISDIGLPGLNGYEVARRLRKMQALSATKLIAISAYGAQEIGANARDAGFDHVLTKPGKIDVLTALLAQPGKDEQSR
jgi:CheY-like chemotaxis protein